MRRHVFSFIAAGSVVASAIACVDLFHPTNDVQSICEADASDPRCDSGTDAAPPVDVCAGDAGAAQARALHACAWLSACAHPIGRNKTGACMVDAIMAYDCNANPNRKPLGNALAFWECMQNATKCADVEHCIFPEAGAPQCTNGGFLGCSQSSVDIDTRVDCVAATDAGAPGEYCGAYGQTCDSLDRQNTNHDAICTGPRGRACTGSFGCTNNKLSLCDDAGVDHGYDCASVGAGVCYPNGASAACKPSGTGTCAGTNDVTCSPGNVEAKGCVAGIPETVDCTAISGAGTCVPIEGGAPGTTPSDACHQDDAGCANDTCDDGGALIACVRGRSVNVSCPSLGLKTCDLVNSEEGLIPSCTPP